TRRSAGKPAFWRTRLPKSWHLASKCMRFHAHASAVADSAQIIESGACKAFQFPFGCVDLGDRGKRPIQIVRHSFCTWGVACMSRAFTQRGWTLSVISAASAAWGFSFGLGLPLGSLWLRDAGCSATRIGLCSSAYYLAAAVASLLLPSLNSRAIRPLV